MVPGGAILRGLPLIGVAITLGDRALRDAVDTVCLVGAQLANAVPVYSCSVTLVVVLDMYFQLVSPASLDDGRWKGPVEDLARRLLKPICSELWPRREGLAISGISSVLIAYKWVDSQLYRHHVRSNTDDTTLACQNNGEKSSRAYLSDDACRHHINILICCHISS